MTAFETIDWSHCPGVERVPGRQGGAPVFAGTRVPVEAVLDNYESGSTVDEIVENFDVTPEQVRAVVAYASERAPHALHRQ
jgi:uncharacterized protein (DUF433 family)